MEQKQNIQTVILNLIQDLQRLPLSLLKNMRGRFQIKFGMTALFNNGGFTLIELLVVVLIIGILAAVAVPQYQKAVVKSQFIQLQLAATTYWKAINAYYLANGDWPSSLNELDVSMNTNSSYKCTFFIHRTDTVDSVRCNLTKYPTLIYGFILRSNPSSSYGYCEASTTSPLENKLCTSIEGAWLSGGNTARNTYSFKLQ